MGCQPLLSEVKQHDCKEKEHHHRTHINKYLNHGKKGGPQKDIDRRHLKQADDQADGAVNRILRRDNPHRRKNGKGREQIEENELHSV